MVRRSTWSATAVATAVGTMVGTGGWLWGIGKYFSPTHPGWALFWITVGVTILTELVTRIVVEEEIRHKVFRRQGTQSSSSPRTPQP
jgi:hypothetical protein